MASSNTTIQITKSQADALREFEEYEGESYKSIIDRLIDVMEESQDSSGVDGELLVEMKTMIESIDEKTDETLDISKSMTTSGRRIIRR